MNGYDVRRCLKGSARLHGGLEHINASFLATGILTHSTAYLCFKVRLNVAGLVRS